MRSLSHIFILCPLVHKQRWILWCHPIDKFHCSTLTSMISCKKGSFSWFSRESRVVMSVWSWCTHSQIPKPIACSGSNIFHSQLWEFKSRVTQLKSMEWARQHFLASVPQVKAHTLLECYLYPFPLLNPQFCFLPPTLCSLLELLTLPDLLCAIQRLPIPSLH